MEQKSMNAPSTGRAPTLSEPESGSWSFSPAPFASSTPASLPPATTPAEALAPTEGTATAPLQGVPPTSLALRLAPPKGERGTLAGLATCAVALAFIAGFVFADGAAPPRVSAHGAWLEASSMLGTAPTSSDQRVDEEPATYESQPEPESAHLARQVDDAATQCTTR